jgi:hypothetical protein
MTPIQLDLPTGLRRKRIGMDQAVSADRAFVLRMRAEAIRLSVERGSVHIDDLRVRAAELGLEPSSGKAWGPIFAGKGWQKVGARRSAHPSNHGHESPVWRWQGDDA